jgi:hypothetical protein
LCWVEVVVAGHCHVVVAGGHVGSGLVGVLST